MDFIFGLSLSHLEEATQWFCVLIFVFVNQILAIPEAMAVVSWLPGEAALQTSLAGEVLLSQHPCSPRCVLGPLGGCIADTEREWRGDYTTYP